MGFRSLRLFLAVLKYGSITKASEHVGVAQPALGLHIRKLEDELGLRLLERHSRGVRATEAGARLAHHAEIILHHMERARRELTNFAKVPSGQIVVGMTPTVREVIAAPLVKRIAAEFPQVQLTIKEALSETLLGYLNDGLVDLALVYNTRDAGEQVVFRPLATEFMHFVYPRDKAECFGETITLAEVMGHPLLLPTRPHLVRTQMDRLALEIGVSPVVLHEVDSVPAIRDFVRQGIGYSVMPPVPEARNGEGPPLGMARVVEPEIQRVLHLAHSQRRPMSKAFEVVARTLVAAVDLELTRDNGQWRPVNGSVPEAGTEP
jgi:LysR family nitrogen assimilation transcriptional regulator